MAGEKKESHKIAMAQKPREEPYRELLKATAFNP